jgi:hypothetical protein
LSLQLISCADGFCNTAVEFERFPPTLPKLLAKLIGLKDKDTNCPGSVEYSYPSHDCPAG